jgi:phosphoenolpyruvate synthase/pyruvate phosphate dikinase
MNMSKEKWFSIETVFDSFPQAFATTYDNKFADGYYRKMGVSSSLNKHLLVFNGDTVDLCNIKDSFQRHIEEIYGKVIQDPGWAEKINERNRCYLDRFRKYINNLEKKDLNEIDISSEIAIFFQYQQLAHVSAWIMAIVDWDKSLLSNFLKEQLKKVEVNKKSVEVVFSELTTNFPPKSKNAKNCLNEIKKKERINDLFEVVRETIELKEYRKGVFNKAFELLAEMWEVLANKKNMRVDLVKFIYPWEVEDFLSGDIAEQELRKRSRNHVFYSDEKQRKVLSGEKAKKFLSKIQFAENVVEFEGKKLKGSVAFRGKSRGVVKIINSKKDLDKMERGDIFVSHMTDPSLFPAFKKCSAIVTDLGGVTCHAAIVAREMKKPCIIGTKIATQVLKDGDEVEVDANNGIVRKLS